MFSSRPIRISKWSTAAVRLSVPLLALSLLISCNSQSSHLAYVTSGNGGVLAYRIRNGNGKVTNIFTAPFLVTDSAAAVVVHPSNRFALVSNQNDRTISQLEIDPTSGALTEKLPRTPAGIAPGPMVLDANGAFLYVADQGLNQILVFSVGAEGALSQVSSAPVAAMPSSLTLTSNGFLFVPVAGVSGIYMFSISSGVLTQVCSSTGPVCLPFNVANGVGMVGVDPSGKFLYVPSPAGNTVSGFAISAAGLAPVPGVIFPTGTSPTAAAVDPSGKFLYVTDSGSNAISEYTIDATTGDLTAFLTPTQTVGTAPTFIAFDPDEKFAYVANANSFTQLLLLSNGTLFSTGNSLSVGSIPRDIAFTK